MSVRELRVFKFLAIVEPGYGRLWVPIHGEGKTPVVMLHSVLEEDDSHTDCWGKQEDSWSLGALFGDGGDKVMQSHLWICFI